MGRARTVAAGCLLALALAAAPASGQQQELRLVIGRSAADAAANLSGFRDVTWLAQDMETAFDPQSTVANRVIHQHPLPATPTGDLRPIDTPITCLVATEVLVPDFADMQVSAAQQRAQMLGLGLAYYTSASAPTPSLDPQLATGTNHVVQNHASTAAKTKIDVGGTVGLVILPVEGDPPPLNKACVVLAAATLVVGAIAGLALGARRARARAP